MITILKNTSALAPGASTVFGASGGTPPYSFYVLPGGVGGTINSSTGLYTAPASSSGGSDTIKVVDSASDEATFKISILTPLELFCEIIRSEMNLHSDQVYLYQQKVSPIKDSRLYIAVGVMGVKPFGSSNKNKNGTEELSANFQATLSVDIMSRNLDALYRKEEIILALDSQLSRKTQSANKFYIGKLSSNFNNLSQEEGAAIPYRFNISVNIHYSVKKSKVVEYFDDFEDIELETDI